MVVMLNVLVTGVGAVIGQGIVSSLRLMSRAVRIVGLDRNANCVGRHFCDGFNVKPACDESEGGYLEFWRKFLVDEKIDIVLPGIEPDVFFLNSFRDTLSGGKAVLALNSAGLIELSRDKWLFSKSLRAGNFHSIPTVLATSWGECLESLGDPPFLLKPRHGSGSRGIVRAAEPEDFLYWTRKAKDRYIAQKIIGSEDEEYTVAAFGLGNGRSGLPIVFRRRLSAHGNTEFAELVREPDIEEAVAQLSRYFHPVGPTNYQFRKEKGVPYVMEINPRFSSSTSIRAGFGYNEAEMTIAFYLDGLEPIARVTESGRAWRYAADYFSR